VKTAIIFHRLGPYHFARLRAAGRMLPVLAIETSGADDTYDWDQVSGADGFERITLFADVDAQKQPAREVACRMMVALDKTRPAVVVVPGWADVAALATLQWCVRNRVPAVIMSESTAWDEPRHAWRERIKRQVVRLAAAGLVGGTPHKEYIIQLGMPAGRVFLGYDMVDNAFFAQSAERIRSQQPAARKTRGLPGKYFLASARFVEKKNLRRLIEAFALYRKKSKDAKPEIGNPKSEPWDLVLLGDGTLRPDLKHLIAGLALQDCVLLPGFKQYSDLPDFYAHASAFVHASTTEQWGLVVNEAMASGLPVLVSNRCGCARDLVQEGVNGFTFDPFNVEELANLMRRISDFGFPISDFGVASNRIIADWGPERFAGGLKESVECALQIGPVKPSWLQQLIIKVLLNK